MNKCNIKIIQVSNNLFLTTLTHPITKNKKRKYFSSKEEASKYKDNAEKIFNEIKSKNYKELSTTELLSLFIQEVPNSAFSKKKIHLIDFIDTFGDCYIKDITTPILKSWLDQVKLENNLQDISMRGIKCEIDTFFNYLVSKEIISESPLKMIYYKKYVPSIKSRNILSPHQISELLSAIKDYSPGYLYPIIKLFTETACKSSELINLNWCDINFNKKKIKLRGEVKGQYRELSISDELTEILSKKDQSTARVFMTYYKELFTSKKLSLAINEFKIKTKYPLQWTPMDLRHSFAINFLSRGGDIKELQIRLGHYNVFETRRLYGEAVIKSINENVQITY